MTPVPLQSPQIDRTPRLWRASFNRACMRLLASFRGVFWPNWYTVLYMTFLRPTCQRYFELHADAEYPPNSMWLHAVASFLPFQFQFYVPQACGMPRSEQSWWTKTRSRASPPISNHAFVKLMMIDVLLVVRTGGGKTGPFYGHILLLKELSKLDTGKKREYLETPFLLLFRHSSPLEEEMASISSLPIYAHISCWFWQEKTFKNLGISALAINENTLACAQTRNGNLLANSYRRPLSTSENWACHWYLRIPLASQLSC